ncbi:hypothetical protein HDV57DRAFT_294323 [Trichoderma longibrachiatum]
MQACISTSALSWGPLLADFWAIQRPWMCALHHGRWTLVPCLELVFLSLLVSSVVSLCWGWTWGATLAWSGTPTGVYLYMLVLVPGLMMVTVVDVSCPLLDTWKSSLFDCQIMEEARLGKKGRAAFAIINTRAYIPTYNTWASSDG